MNYPWNGLPTLQIIPVRDEDALRVFAPFQVSDFVPVATHRIGVVRLDPVATPPGTPGTFAMPQTAVLQSPTLPETLVGGPGGPNSPTDIAYDAGNDKLYAVAGSLVASDVFELNKSTGVVISQVTLDTPVFGLEFDESTGLLYAVDNNTNNLLTIAPSVFGGGPPAPTTIIGNTGVAIKGLAQDPLTGTLYGATNTDLYVINKTTGLATLVGGFGGSISMEGLAFDTKRRKLFGVGLDGSARIYEISVAVGTATLVGVTLFAHTGLAYDSLADELLVQVGGVTYKFTYPPAEAEWGITFDLELEIDGNANFIDNDGFPTLIISSAVLPNEDEYYLLGVIRKSDNKTLDFALIFKEKANLDIFDTTSKQVDLSKLETALALAGHNVRYRLISLATGQPANHEIELFNPSIVGLSTDEEDLDDSAGAFKKISLTTDVDSTGDVIRVDGKDA